MKKRSQSRTFTIIGDALAGIPWQDRPAGSSEVVWRYSANPVIPRDLFPGANSIFNSAVVPFRDEFAGVFRADSTCRNMRIHNGRSKDGFTFEIEPEPITWVCNDPEIGHFVEAYDPRVVRIDDRYFITWCNNYHGYTIGMGYTDDFKAFHQMENAFLPLNRNRCSLPQDGRRTVSHAKPAQRHRPHPVRRHLRQSKPGPHPRAVIATSCRPRAASSPGNARKSAPAPCPSRRPKGCSSFYHGAPHESYGFCLQHGRGDSGS